LQEAMAEKVAVERLAWEIVAEEENGSREGNGL
jgi:hypothetical protein